MKKRIIAAIMIGTCLMLSACSGKETDMFGSSGQENEESDKNTAADLIDYMTGGSILKYVDKSRMAMDCTNYDSLANSLTVALLSDSKANLGKDGNYMITMTENGVVITKSGQPVGDDDGVVATLKELLGSDFLNSYERKTKDAPDYVIETDYDGVSDFPTVKKTVNPNDLKSNN